MGQKLKICFEILTPLHEVIKYQLFSIGPFDIFVSIRWFLLEINMFYLFCEKKSISQLLIFPFQRFPKFSSNLVTVRQNHSNCDTYSTTEFIARSLWLSSVLHCWKLSYCFETGFFFNLVQRILYSLSRHYDRNFKYLFKNYEPFLPSYQWSNLIQKHDKKKFPTPIFIISN